MADTITSYEGNANLGAGSNANIASPTDVRLFEGSNQAMSDAFKTINDTHKTIALMNFEFNQKIFAQKVKDRDTLMDMLDKGEAVIGNYRKEDKKHLDEAQKDYDEKFDKYYNKGINDRDAMREFKAAASKLKDVGTKLQIRYNHEQTEKGEIAKEPIIAKKEARQKKVLFAAGRAYRRVIWTFVVITGLVVLAAAYLMLASADITIKAKALTVSADVNVTIANLTGKTTTATSTPGVVKTVSFAFTKAYPVTGSEMIGQSVIGNVIVYNNYSKAQPLIASTRLLSPDGKLYRLSQTVVVPAGGSVATSNSPSSKRILSILASVSTDPSARLVTV